MAAVKQPWEGFTADYTLVPARFDRYNPLPAYQQISPYSPRLIILCTWTDATPKNIRKYVDGYRVLFPTTPILVVQTASTSWFTSETSLLDHVSPSISIILKALESVEDGVRFGKQHILAHALSNGGCGHFTFLARRFLADTGFALPVGALVLDSTPTRPTFSTLLASLSLSLPKSSFVRQPLKLLVGIAIFVAYVIPGWLGASNLAEKVYQSLLSPDASTEDKPYAANEGWLSRECLRCYIFSSADLICPDQEILAHIQKSASIGLHVRKEIWNNSGHVEHLRVDPARYWSVVKQTWEQVCLTRTNSRERTRVVLNMSVLRNGTCRAIAI